MVMFEKNFLSVKSQVQISINNNRKRIGILGGTFNPPHLGHLIIADQVAKQLDLYKVYLMPNYIPPHLNRKIDKDILSIDKRLDMLNLSIINNNKLDIETIEAFNHKVSYTYDTMLKLKQIHKNVDYYFIIGEDMVADLPNWKNINDLQKIVTFVGVKRLGFHSNINFPILWVDVPFIDISSTAIRRRVKDGCSIKYFVTQEVEKYIKEKRIYC